MTGATAALPLALLVSSADAPALIVFPSASAGRVAKVGFAVPALAPAVE